MRILFASMPADGHFNPLTGIAVNLADRGHDVRWYAGPAYGAKLDRLGMRWFPYRQATEIMAGNLDDLFPERAGLKGPRLISFELDTFFVSQVENHFQDLVNIRQEWPFDALVCDGALYAEQLVAESLHDPRVRRRLDDGDAGREGAAAVLRVAPCTHSGGPAAPRHRAPDAGQWHEGRGHSLQRDPRRARHRTDTSRRLPARTDAEDPAGVPQRLSGTGVPRLPASRQRRVRRTTRPGPHRQESRRPHCPTSSSTSRTASWRSRRAPSTTPTRAS